MLTELGLVNASLSFFDVPTPRRTTLNSATTMMDEAGIAEPLATRYEFVSGDGSAYFAGENPEWPSFQLPENGRAASINACMIDITDCFGDDFAIDEGSWTVQDTMKRISFEKPECGDCVIVALLGKSGQEGLKAFLPSKIKAVVDEDEDESVQMLSLEKAFASADFKPLSNRSLRQQAIALITRYSYAIGNSAVTFVSVSGQASLHGKLYQIDQRRPSFLALNDDLSARTSADTVKSVDKIIHDWLDKSWSTKAAAWEN